MATRRKSRRILGALLLSVASGVIGQSFCQCFRQNPQKYKKQPLPTNGSDSLVQTISRFLRDFHVSNNLRLTSEEITVFVNKHSEELTLVFANAVKSDREARQDLVRILEKEYTSLSHDELQSITDARPPASEDSFTVSLVINGRRYQVVTDTHKWRGLFLESPFGYGPEMALKTAVWQLCSKTFQNGSSSHGTAKD